MRTSAPLMETSLMLSPPVTGIAAGGLLETPGEVQAAGEAAQWRSTCRPERIAGGKTAVAMVSGIGMPTIIQTGRRPEPTGSIVSVGARFLLLRVPLKTQALRQTCAFRPCLRCWNLEIALLFLRHQRLGRTKNRLRLARPEFIEVPLHRGASPSDSEAEAARTTFSLQSFRSLSL